MAELGKFINPLIDEGFKRLFGTPESKGILLFFLNSLFEGQLQIEDLEYKGGECLPEVPGGRRMIHDIYCTTSAGEHIIVEMQNQRHTHFEERCLYYMSGAVTRQAEKGSAWGFDVKAVFGIFFTDFRIKANCDELVSHYSIKNESTGEPFTDRWRMIFINLPNMRLSEQECGTDLEKFIYVFKNMSTMDTMPFIKEKKIWKEISDRSVINNMSRAERDSYEYGLNQLRIARIRDEDMRAEGRAEGLEEGLSKGFTKGIAQMVRNMFRSGLSPEIIAGIADISVGDVLKIIGR